MRDICPINDVILRGGEAGARDLTSDSCADAAEKILGGAYVIERPVHCISNYQQS